MRTERAHKQTLQTDIGVHVDVDLNGNKYYDGLLLRSVSG